jgi:hypothetical protein
MSFARISRRSGHRLAGRISCLPMHLRVAIPASNLPNLPEQSLAGTAEEQQVSRLAHHPKKHSMPVVGPLRVAPVQ